MAKQESSKSALSNSFMDNHKDVNEDVASELIVKSEQKIRLIQQERVADEKLTQARQIVKDLSSAYKSATAYEYAKIDFLLEKIEEIQSGDVNLSSGANT